MKRLYSLDVLRGLTVAAMVVVNNAGGKDSFPSLQHSAWNGFTLCDMVFPCFLFMVGVSTYISLSKSQFAWSGKTVAKIAKRSLWILLIGWALHWIESMCKGDFFPLQTIRLTGVLPRIAVCYFATAMLAVTVRSTRRMLWIAAGLLVGYAVLLLCGNGYEYDSTNILARIDNAVIGHDHLYTKKPIDPEGLAGCLSAIAHCIIGFWCGSLLFAKKGADNLSQRLLLLMVAGFGLLLLGLALEPLMPFNKRIWSPSFTLAACGYAALALGLLGYITDMRDIKRPFWPLDVFGVNPLFLYALSELAAIAISALGIKGDIYQAIASVIAEPRIASLIYSLAFTFVMWLPGYWLYRKKIYIKL